MTCDGDACITCGDIAVEVRVLRLLPAQLALVDPGHGKAEAEEVSVALVDAAPGDTILVHAGEAIAVVQRRGAA
jgi:hydrogenase expression/formation protein HypC